MTHCRMFGAETVSKRQDLSMGVTHCMYSYAWSSYGLYTTSMVWSLLYETRMKTRNWRGQMCFP